MADGKLHRLARLVTVMQRLKDYHQARHAGHLAQAAAARSDADDIAARLDAGEEMSALFPELYHRRIASALQHSRDSAERARAEAQNVLAADRRGDALARAYREASDLDERDRADKERLEFLQHRGAPRA